MNQTNSDSQLTANEQAEHIQTAPQPKKSHKTLIVVLCIIGLLAIGATVAVVTLNRSSSEERLAYEVLENNDNPQDYKDFLDKYPNSDRAQEVRERLQILENMLRKWESIALSGRVRDFEDFKQTYSNTHLLHLCDLKIDSLDFIQAQQVGTQEAFGEYLRKHPDGQYASEASVAQGNLRDMEVTDEDCERIASVLVDFFHGFESQDETAVCSNITATMKTFLHQKNATKATVISTIKNMFHEHILSCQFNVNRDMEISRKAGSTGGFTATFTLDQYIDRDNEGKTFGSYRCVAELTPQLLIESLTMEEISKN